MSSVDSRIVTMKFDNTTFEKNAATSLSTLERLKASLNFGTIVSAASKSLSGIATIFGKFGVHNPFASAQQGASDLNRATQQVESQGLTTLTGGISHVSSSFVAMATVAITAIANITNRLVNAGYTWIKSFTVAPILDGLHEYQTTLQSIQTVQANTDEPLPKIEAALQRLNAYSDTTIYNFGQMAKNVGTFTAAGVDLETSVASIQGIANIAALSGSSAEQAATAMYQLSQAIAAGRVGLMDWNSVVNAGMGGKKFQNALLQTAVAMGKIGENSVKLVGPMEKLTVNGQSFRESIMAQPGEESWLSSDILVNTLAALDGRFSVAYQKAQLTEQGLRKFTDAQIKANMAEARANLEKKNGVKFSEEQYKALLQMAEAATEAAQDVKTLGQVFDIAKETIGSGWAASFKSIFGNLDESKELFTGMSNALGDIIRKNALARNTLLAGWKDLGGRDRVIKGLKNIFEALLDVLAPIRKAFRDIFPAKTSQDLAHMSKVFRDFTAGLTIGDETAQNLRRTFRGVFAIFHIIGQVIGAVFDQFQRLFGAISDGSGGFLNFTGGVGDFLVALDKMLEKEGFITTFFNGIGDIIAIPLNLLSTLASMFASLFDGFDSSGSDQVTKGIDKFTQSLTPLETVVQTVKNVFHSIGDAVGNLSEIIGHALTGLGDMIADVMTADSFEGALDVLNTVLLGGIVLLLRNFFKGGLKLDFGGGVLDSVKETLGGVTDVLKTMQADVRANIILKIAGALAILTASLVVLSMIEGDKLKKALLTMGVGFAGLQVALISLNAFIGLGGTIKLPFITASLLALSTSMLLFATAIKIMSTIKLGDLVSAMVGMNILIKSLGKAMTFMPVNLPVTAAGLVILGVALNELALAVLLFSKIGYADMIRGMLGITGALLAIGPAMQLMPINLPITAAGLVLLGEALLEIGLALKVFATMKWKDIGKGLTVLAGALAIIAAAMNLMPISLPITAAGLILVGIALSEIALAVKLMGKMGWKEIGKGMTVLGGAMAILAIGLNLMSGALLGAAALTVAAGALAILTPVLATLGNLDWSTILTALGTLAALFVILGAAGYLLAPVVPVIFALSVSLLLIGAGLALAGVAALAFSTAFAVLVGALSVGSVVVLDVLGKMIAGIPGLMSAFAQAIIQSGPDFVTAINEIVSNFLQVIIDNAPKAAEAFLAMLDAALKVVVQMTPKIVEAGFRLLLSFLDKLSDNTYRITAVVGDIIVKFTNGLADNLKPAVQAGVNFLIKWIEALTAAIKNNDERLGRAVANLGIAIVEGIVVGIWAAADQIKDAMIDIAEDAWDDAKDFLHIPGAPSKLFRDTVGVKISEGMAAGIADGGPAVSHEINQLGKSSVNAMKSVMSGLSSAIDLDPNMSPTVTPVLDLTKLQKDAAKIDAMLPSKSISAGALYEQASSISAEQLARMEEHNQPKDDHKPEVREIKIEQTNISPKALNEVEIYRNTRNAVSLAKEALNA